MRRRWCAAAAAVLLVSGCTSHSDEAVGSDPGSAPTPSPSWTPGTVVPSVAKCPEGSARDSPRSADHPSPFGPAAFDAQSGRLVVVSSFWGWGPVQSTSFDVCTNTWKSQKDGAWTQVSWGGPAVVYDPGTDAVLALTVSQTRPTRCHARTRPRPTVGRDHRATEVAPVGLLGGPQTCGPCSRPSRSPQASNPRP